MQTSKKTNWHAIDSHAFVHENVFSLYYLVKRKLWHKIKIKICVYVYSICDFSFDIN